MPETAKMLVVIANQIKQATSDFQQTASELTGTYSGVAVQARQAMTTMVHAVDSSAHYSQHAQEKLVRTYVDARKWLIYTSASVALVLGLLFGTIIGWYLHTPAPAAAEAVPASEAQTMPAVPEPSALPPAPVPKSKPKPVHTKQAPKTQAQQDGGASPVQ